MRHRQMNDPSAPSPAVEREMLQCRDEFLALTVYQIDRLKQIDLQKSWPPHHVVLYSLVSALGLNIAAWLITKGIQEDAAHAEVSKLVTSILSGANDIADRLLRQPEDN